MITNSSYFASLPQKRMASEIIFLDKRKDVLLVKPTYRENWGVPGGTIEENESPKQAAIREVQEELGLSVRKLKLIAVDYTTPSGPKNEAIMFVFFGGVLKEKEIARIKLPADELKGFKFESINDAVLMVFERRYHTSLPERLETTYKALSNGKTYYLEDGKNI